MKNFVGTHKSGCMGILGVALLFSAAIGCRKQDFPEYPANYREYAYITNADSGTVTVLDVINVRVDREIPVGENPVAVSVSPKRNEVYIVNSGAAGSQGSISVIDAEKNVVVSTIAVHKQPGSIDLDPNGDIAYVSNTGSNTVSVIDLKQRSEMAQIGTGEEPIAVRTSSDGKTLAVANRKSNSLSLIDTASRKVRSTFGNCPGAADTVFLPDASKAFVACSGGHQVMAISLAHGALPDRLEAILDVGQGPTQLAMKPDGGELFAVNTLSNTISEVATYTDEVGGATIMGDAPVRGLVSSDNSLLYVGNLHSQELTIYSIDDGRRMPASVHVGDGPSALAFSASGKLLFVVDARSNDVAVVRTGTFGLFTLLPTGRRPNAIAVKAFRVQ